MKGSIVQRGDSISLWGEEIDRSERFSGYKKEFFAIRDFLKTRFNLTINPETKKRHPNLAKHSYVGYKKEIFVLYGIRGRYIEVKFGVKKNLWQNLLSSWDEWQKDYQKPSYLESKRIELELKKLWDFLQSFKDYDFRVDRENLSPVEFILKREAENKYIHGGAKTLEELASYVASRKMPSYNVEDKNKKRLQCGETKYFYCRRTRRLMKGVVYHNSNNMWWVIAGKEVKNMPNFELFDHHPDLERKKAASKGDIEHIIARKLKKKDYLACHHIALQHRDILSNVA